MALFQAAAEVVGDVGYAEASVSRITKRAKVAQGTFYNYFRSRQDLFDQLLPRLGQEMLLYIQKRVEREARGAEREAQRLRAYFDYLEENPHFYRILYEAETLAPDAHRHHIDVVIGGYLRSMGRSRRRGEMPGYNDDELEAIAYMLVAMRGYLSMRYGVKYGGGRVPDWVVEAYRKLIANGLFAEDSASASDGVVTSAAIETFRAEKV